MDTADRTSDTQREREENDVTGNKINGKQEPLRTNGHADARGSSSDEAEEPEAKEQKKPSIMSRVWKKMDLDVPTVLMMMKAGLPPTIALAMYQADDIAGTYATIGYLMGIISILGFCIMPRAKFIQTMLMNVLAICIAAAVAMLQLWSGVQARKHTTPPGLPPARYRYNSSQSAVCGIWLFFQIWLTNSIKAKFPQFAFPTVLYAIFANVASTSGAQFQTTAQAENFVQRLLETFLTGFAIAAGVSLFIFPVSCRTVVTKEMTVYIGALRGALKAHKAYFKTLETKDIFRQMTHVDGSEDEKKEKIRPEITAVKESMAGFLKLHGKLNADLPFAKREIAYGRLTPDDFESLFKNLRAVMSPLVGVGSTIDILNRLAELNGWEKDDAEDQDAKNRVLDDWHDLMSFTHDPLQNILDTMDQGLQHIALRMEFTKAPKKRTDPSNGDAEEKGDMIQPGSKEFAAYFDRQSEEFYAGRERILTYWLQQKGIKADEDFFQVPEGNRPGELNLHKVKSSHRTQRQLFLVLYIIFLLHSVSVAILEFIKWADEHDQATTKKRLITPGKKRFKKWIASMFSSQDANQDDETTNVGLNRAGVVHMGEAYKGRKDPEHLPPANAWEKFGNMIRKFSGFLRSPESAFGFRVAVATMSIAIIAYLQDTQLWFTKQRVVWAMLMVALSMTPTSGLSTFNFVLRVAGTAIAMLCAWLVWYIPDKKTPGVLVFLWLFISLGHWIPLKRPELLIAGLISMVTCVLIVGYELQVRKLGVRLATSNGQPFYEITKLGPYRLACVVAGIGVAAFWTYVPYPITEHSTLRNKLGGALYLSANLYSIMHETVMARIRNDGGDPDDKYSPAYQLLKARNKVFAKQMLTLQALRQHSAMVDYEFPLGGKFPKKEYDAIIGYISNITNYSSLLGLASRTFVHPSLCESEADPSRLQWFHDFQRIITESKITSHEITSLLSLLSSSVVNGVPLPPYLTPPTAYHLSTKLETVDRDILSIRHIGEPGYAAFAVIQISTKCIQMDIERLLKMVKTLVGELDFSFHVVSTSVGSEETLVGRNKLD